MDIRKKDELFHALPLFLTLFFIFSILFYISNGSDKENLFVNQEFLILVINSFILITFSFDLKV